MEITLEETDTKGRYLARSPEGAEAEMTFSKLGEKSIIIDHTGVPDSLLGQGYGQALLARAVEDMRIQGKTIIPLCPFAAAQFRRHREYADVLNR